MFVPGHNCRSIAQASKIDVLVDGDAFFSTVQQVLAEAQRSIFILGWDLHSQTDLAPTLEPPGRLLGEMLSELVGARPELEIFLLAWDPSPIYALEREFLPKLRHRWGTHPRVHFEWASDHPLGGSQHQKVIVVDDTIAFVGGIDMTISRWDTREHHQSDPRRVLPNGASYGPFHDVQVVLEGPVVTTLAKLARARWQRATTVPVPPIEPAATRWPPCRPTPMTDVRVAVACTQPPWNGHEAVRDVERLYIDMIEAARDTIYLENQFITSRRVCDALSARLRQDQGPEVVIVTSDHGLGPLESRPLLAQRDRFVQRLRANDRHGRLGIYAPMVDPTCAVKVHSKVTVIDDRYLRIGSSNLSNRAMALDSECDIVVEASRPDVAAWIHGVRDDLLIEHLDVTPAQWSEALQHHEGRVLATLQALRGGARTLKPIEEGLKVTPYGILECFADAEEPLDQEFIRMSIPDSSLRRHAHARLPRLALSALVIIALLGLWTMTPVASLARPERIAEAAEALRGHAWGPPVALMAFCLASALMFPVTILIIACALLFPPTTAAVIALLGSLSATTASYWVGRHFWSDSIARWVGPRLQKLTRRLSTTGVFSIVLIRIIPVAPFAVINLVAGGARVPLATLLLGTLFGMAPGILALVFATDRVVAAAKQPDPVTIAVAVGILALIGLGVVGLGKLLGRDDAK